MTDLKEVKHHCVFCKDPILPDEKSGWDGGCNPEPLIDFNKGRSCNQCTQTGVFAARAAEMQAYKKINELNERITSYTGNDKKAVVIEEYKSLIDMEKENLNQYFKTIIMCLDIEAKKKRGKNMLQ